MNNEEINKKLEELAYKRTIPFCYMCYQDAPSGYCSQCLSDDLMRHLPGVGVEYGTCWVIEHILQKELEEVDQEQIFEESIESSYPENIQIGFIKYTVVEAIITLDPIARDIEKSDYISSLIEDSQVFEYESMYFKVEDVEELLE